jgi:hypothetical protein
MDLLLLGSLGHDDTVSWLVDPSFFFQFQVKPSLMSYNLPLAIFLTVAPEVCACKNYGLKADVYSFAIVFWEVFSGQDAYQKMSFDRHFDHVVVHGKRPNPKAAAISTKNLSKSLLHLMSDMWQPNPKDRPTFRNICDRLAGECILSTNQRSRTLDGESNRNGSYCSHQSQLTDRTRYLMNRSLRSRYADVESNGS